MSKAKKYFYGKTHKQTDAAEVECGLSYFKIFDASWETKNVNCKKCLKTSAKKRKQGHE